MATGVHESSWRHSSVVRLARSRRRQLVFLGIGSPVRGLPVQISALLGGGERTSFTAVITAGFSQVNLIGVVFITSFTAVIG